MQNLFSIIMIIFFQPELRTLVTVTEMLTKHKQKYTEMISNTSTINSHAMQNTMQNLQISAI